MKHYITKPLAGLMLATTLLGSGCAASYHSILPERVVTTPPAAAPQPLGFAYQFDALRALGHNKKYIKRQNKQGYQVVAVRVTNNTTTDINFSRDAVLYYGDRPVTPVANGLAANDMKQGVLIYLLYVLLNPTFSSSTSTNGYQTSSNSSTLYIGPFIAGGNMLGAGLANKHFRSDLELNDLTNRTIRPGETVFGVVCLRETNVMPLRLELRTVAANTPTPLPAATPAGMPLPPASTPTRN